MIHEALNDQRYVKTAREAHLTMRHSNVLEIRFWIMLSRVIVSYCYEHEICYHSLSSGKSDFVEITPHPTGLTACTVHSGLAASEPVERESAWHVILAAEPEHMIIHPIIPDQWPQKTQRAFWHVGAEVCRWQDDRGHFVTIMYSAHSGFWLSQCCRSLKWRNSMTFATFKNKQKQQYGEISFLTNLPEGSLDRLESLEEGYDSEKTFDPRFALLLSQCLVGDGRSDRPICLRISLKTLMMELFVPCVCDPKGTPKHCQYSLQRKSTLCCQTIRKANFRIPFGLSLHNGL